LEAAGCGAQRSAKSKKSTFDGEREDAGGLPSVHPSTQSFGRQFEYCLDFALNCPAGNRYIQQLDKHPQVGKGKEPKIANRDLRAAKAG
jgi:hypothetical protein